MISCKQYAEIKKQEYKNFAVKMPLSIIQVGDNPASNTYIKGKMKDCQEVGIVTYLYKLPEDVTQHIFNKTVEKAVKNNGGLIIQLPIPERLYFYDIPAWQDVDGLYYDNYNPCTAEGIIDWLEYNQIDLTGQHVTILGRSELVGWPLAKMMLDRNATVSVCHSRSRSYDIETLIQNSDIIVSATGHRFPAWFCPHHLYGKKIFIDVGINRDENNKLHGDLDCSALESQGHYVTPVPGGVGLLTRVTLLKHLVNPIDKV